MPPLSPAGFGVSRRRLALDQAPPRQAREQLARPALCQPEARADRPLRHTLGAQSVAVSVSCPRSVGLPTGKGHYRDLEERGELTGCQTDARQRMVHLPLHQPGQRRGGWQERVPGATEQGLLRELIRGRINSLGDGHELALSITGFRGTSDGQFPRATPGH
jgi:hypothetical protein